MNGAKGLRQKIIRRVQHLSEDQLQEVLHLLSALASREKQRGEAPAPSQQARPDPILDLIGTVEVKPFADQVDEELYGA